MGDIELISQREAAWVMDVRHDLSRPRVTRLLATGIAGEARRAGGALLYDADRVRRLGERRRLTRPDIDALGLPRLIVARRAVDVLADRATQVAQLADGWNLNIFECLRMIWHIQDDEPIPLVATVSGFVILGAELTGFAGSAMAPGKRVRLVVREPGAWFDALRETRLDLPPGARFTLLEQSQSDAGPPKPSSLPSGSR